MIYLIINYIQKDNDELKNWFQIIYFEHNHEIIFKNQNINCKIIRMIFNSIFFLINFFNFCGIFLFWILQNWNNYKSS